MSTFKLTRSSETTASSVCNNTVWILHVEAESDVEDVDANVFVYHIPGYKDPVRGAAFCCVATVDQMNSIPIMTTAVINSIIEENNNKYGWEKETTENEDGEIVSADDDITPYMRTSTVTLSYDHPARAERDWKEIQRYVQELLVNTSSYLRMVEVESVSYDENGNVVTNP